MGFLYTFKFYLPSQILMLKKCDQTRKDLKLFRILDFKKEFISQIGEGWVSREALYFLK